MNKRLTSIDSLRGFLAILVVLGHTALGLKGCRVFKGAEKTFISNLYFLIYSFHMPAFFAISGYLYSTNRLDSPKSLAVSIRHRLFSLGIPYILCSVLYWCIKYSLSFLVEEPVSIQDLLNIPVIPVEFLWYLYALLGIYILADVIRCFYKNTTVLCLIFLAIAFFMPNFKSSYGITKVLPNIGYFYLGCVLRKYEGKHWEKILSGFLFFYLIYVYLNSRSQELKFFISICGTIFLFRLFSGIQKENLFSNIGQRTMPLYVLHAIFVGGIRILLLRIGIKNLPLHLMLGFFLPLAACYFGYDIIKRIPPLDFCFYPGKYKKN